MSPEFLFSKDCLLAFVIQRFSFDWHKLHCFFPFLYTVACFIADQSVLKGRFFSLRFQTVTQSESGLSKHVWNLKLKNWPFKIEWSVTKYATVYRSGGKQCNLCLEEKLWNMKANKQSLLNKRLELFALPIMVSSALDIHAIPVTLSLHLFSLYIYIYIYIYIC